MRRFDLHVHSWASDGVLGPGDVARAAARGRLAGFALTDHDSVAGLPEAARVGNELGIRVIPGIEISVSEAEGARQMHVLGLGLDPDHPGLLRRLETFHRERLERGRAMLERLGSLGIVLPEALLRDAAARGSVGRPHVARALVARGVCRTMQEAFDRFIGHRGPAYVPRPALPAGEVIAAIHDAGGVAVLAHPPLSVGVESAGGLERFVERLAREGIDGLEVRHPRHRAAMRRRLSELARALGLLETGGSDFHGDEKPRVRLGLRQDLAVGEEELDRLLARGRGGRVPSSGSRFVDRSRCRG